jgi:hypothetical protein
MKASTFNRAELDAAMRLTPEEKTAMHAALTAAVIKVYSAELEPVPEVESVVSDLIEAFEAGRARQIREQLSLAMLQIATACVGPPPNLRPIVDGIFNEYEDGYSQAGALLLSAEQQTVVGILSAVEGLAGKAAAAGVLRLMGAHRVSEQARAGPAAKKRLSAPVKAFVRALWDATPRRDRAYKLFGPAALLALADRQDLGPTPTERGVFDWITEYKKELANKG